MSITETSESHSGDGEPERAWSRLTSKQRRVLGVLIEKAKTTPDAYPMTINGLTNGCNQKSNRSPQMELNGEEVEEILDELRQLGAVTEIQGSGRVAKYRHHAYEWFAVDKFEVAVIAELLLRGEQTLGELRARASRMETIRDQRELKEVIHSLLAKELMIELTPPGRGQIVTHALYTDRERATLEQHHGPISQSNVGRERTAASPPTASASMTADVSSQDQTESIPSRPSDTASLPESDSSNLAERLENAEFEIESLKQHVGRLEEKLDSLIQ